MLTLTPSTACCLLPGKNKLFPYSHSVFFFFSFILCFSELTLQPFLDFPVFSINFFPRVAPQFYVSARSDQINDVFPEDGPTGKRIWETCFTYHLKPIFAILFQRFNSPGLIFGTWLCGTGFISQNDWVVDFHLINMIRRKCLPPSTTTHRNTMQHTATHCFSLIYPAALKGKSAGLALKHSHDS